MIDLAPAQPLWWDTLGSPVVPRPPLPGDVDADVAIVGAGYTGLWTAYYLLRSDPGLRVVVVEQQVAGFGASGRNGGWCSALFPTPWERIAASSSREDAIALQMAMHDSVDEVGNVAAAEGLDIHWAKGGTLTLARSPAQLQRAQEQVQRWRAWGFGAEHMRLLDADEARARAGATDLRGATYSPHCAAIHPGRLVRGLADIVAARGALLAEGTTATSIEAGAVRTDRGIVRAPFVIRATEGFTASLPGHRRTLLPVYSLMLATEPLPDRVWDSIGLAGRPTFTDGRHLIVYGQRTTDGRIAFGGRGAPYHLGSRVRPGYDTVRTVHEQLWNALQEMFPVLRGVRVTHRWGGPLGIPRDWYPSVGLDRRTGLGWSGGYVGDGVATSNLGGRTLADLILERRTPVVSLPWVSRRSRRWEPEPLRWIGANAARAVMGSADRAERRTGRPARRAAIVDRVIGH